MAYIQRDSAGKITAIFESPQFEGQEQLALDAPELIEYLAKDNAKVILAASDADLVRVLEDLINTLIDKQVIMFTDLPLAAREKLVSRERIRGHLTNLDNLVDDGESLL